MINHIIKKLRQQLPNIYKVKGYKKIKKDKSIVTKSDKMIQNIIISELKKKLKDNFYLISEEKKNIKINQYSKFKYIITLDPIDGTENFYAGLPEWGISISIYKNENHFESCIFLPDIGKILKTNNKIKRNNSKIKSFSSTINLSKIKRKDEFRLFGCCVYSIYHVIKGSLKEYKSEKANSWDILAGANLAIENGLNVKIDNKKYYGKFLHSNKKYKIQISN
jgi:myo-inositol-1(or 4)-monophosphatase